MQQIADADYFRIPARQHGRVVPAHAGVTPDGRRAAIAHPPRTRRVPLACRRYLGDRASRGPACLLVVPRFCQTTAAATFVNDAEGVSQLDAERRVRRGRVDDAAYTGDRMTDRARRKMRARWRRRSARTEAEAERMLGATALVTCNQDGERLAGYIEALLARTLARVQRGLDVRFRAGSRGRCRQRDRRALHGLLRSSSASTGTGSMCAMTSPLRWRRKRRSRPIVELVAACYAVAAAVSTTRSMSSSPVAATAATRSRSRRSLYGFRDRPGSTSASTSGCASWPAPGRSATRSCAGLSVLNVHGKLHVCDPDDASDGNLNRCWWFGL